MTTKKTTTTKAKVTNPTSTFYISVDKIGTAESAYEGVLCAISDCEYYSNLKLNEVISDVASVEEDTDQDVFKVTLTKVGVIKKSEVIFVKDE
jgi:hypothetical protein